MNRRDLGFRSVGKKERGVPWEQIERVIKVILVCVERNIMGFVGWVTTWDWQTITSVLSAITGVVSAAIAYQSSKFARENVRQQKYADIIDWGCKWDVDENTGKGFVIFRNIGENDALKVHPTVREPGLTNVGKLVGKKEDLEKMVPGSAMEFFFDLDMRSLRKRGERPLVRTVNQSEPMQMDGKEHCFLVLRIAWEDSGGRHVKEFISDEIN